NRNHQAVLLAMTAPMLALWAGLPNELQFQAMRKWIALAFALYLLPMILATGSRAGLALGAFGFAAAFLIWRRVSGPRTWGKWGKLVAAIAAALAIAVFVLALVLSRDEAIQRFLGGSLEKETRLSHLPMLLEMAKDFIWT